MVDRFSGCTNLCGVSKIIYRVLCICRTEDWRGEPDFSGFHGAFRQRTESRNRAKLSSGNFVHCGCKIANKLGNWGRLEVLGRTNFVWGIKNYLSSSMYLPHRGLERRTRDEKNIGVSMRRLGSRNVAKLPSGKFFVLW